MSLVLLLPSTVSSVKRRKLRHRKEQILPVQQLPSPPPSPEPELMFTREIDEQHLPPVLEANSRDGHGSTQQQEPTADGPHSEASESTTDHKFVRRRARIGRGGRIIFDRCHIFHLLLLVQEWPCTEQPIVALLECSKLPESSCAWCSPLCSTLKVHPPMTSSKSSFLTQNVESSWHRTGW